MAKLYYGDGKCDIEGSGVRAVEIRYRGAILIDDKTSDSFAITAQKDGIMIFPIKEGEELNKLFEYTGEFKITSLIVAGVNAERISTSIHRVMDYTELLTGETETITANTEDLKVTHQSMGRRSKTELKQPYIKNLHTSDGTPFYFENGDSYAGYYHISLVDNSVMTGVDREGGSQLLYIKQVGDKLISTLNPTHIPPGVSKRRKQDRKKRRSKPKIRKSSY